MNFTSHVKRERMTNTRRRIEFSLQLAKHLEHLKTCQGCAQDSKFLQAMQLGDDENLPEKIQQVMATLRAAGMKDVRVERMEPGEDASDAIERVKAKANKKVH